MLNFDIHEEQLMIYITVLKMKLIITNLLNLCLQLYPNPFFPSKNSKYVTKIIEIILKNELYIN
jgi:hypothetical protein